MKKIILCSFILLTGLYSFSQRVNKIITDTKTQKPILYGKCNLKGLQTGEFGEIYRMEYKYYAPDSNILKQIKPQLKNISFKIVLGSWCGDSREQIPRFIKVLDLSGYNTKKVKFTALDHYFKLEGFDNEKFEIKKLPTIIVYRNKKEIGRIIETPVDTPEKDLLNILKNK
jgi:thiol-disulfide isomerase/thioredoxin